MFGKALQGARRQGHAIGWRLISLEETAIVRRMPGCYNSPGKRPLWRVGVKFAAREAGRIPPRNTFRTLATHSSGTLSMLSPSRFAFEPRTLDRPRPRGISALMRIRNGGDFLEEAIESHIEFFDEIVAVHNDCGDDSVPILERLQGKHGGKLRVLCYEPEVHALGSAGHRRATTCSIHGMANYSNYALANTTYSVVTKLDDDHIAIRGNVGAITGLIRNLGCQLDRRMICFSGINLVAHGAELGIPDCLPFVGDGDHWFLQANSRNYFRQDRRFERFDRRGLRMEYHGIAYWHLKYLKRGNGFDNYQLDRNPGSRFHRQRRRFESGKTPISLLELESRCRTRARSGGVIGRLKRFISDKERLRHERNEQFLAAALHVELEKLKCWLAEKNPARGGGMSEVPGTIFARVA